MNFPPNQSPKPQNQSPKTDASFPPHLRRAALRGLYVITDARMGGGHIAIARAALAAGARIVQLRDKQNRPRQILPIAHELRALTRQSGALFLINDRIDIALACDADGVHLGPDDMDVASARRVLGPHRLIGASCHNPAQARAARDAGADYIGAGAIFGTSTKSDAGEAIGLDALRAVVAATELPVAAIGGVDLSNISTLRETGAQMACVISAVARAQNHDAMIEATRALIASF